MNGRMTSRTLGVWCLATAAGFLLIHGLLATLMRVKGVTLGAVIPEFAPLYAYWNPHLKIGLIAPLIASFLYLRWARQGELAERQSDTAAIFRFTAWFLLLTLSLPLIDGGPGVWIGPYASRPDLEYFGAVETITSFKVFLRDYVSRLDQLPMHARVHPPGAIVLLAVLTRLFGGGPWAAALGSIGFSALAVPLVFGLARSIGGPLLARRATALFVATPSVLLFTTTSMDGPFMVALIATLVTLWQAFILPSPRAGMVAGIAAAAASMLTYSVAIVLVFAAIAWAWSLVSRPSTRNRLLLTGGTALGAFLFTHALIWAVTGFNPLDMLQHAISQDHTIMAGTRHESLSRHLMLAVGNLSAFAIGAGVPTVSLFFHSLRVGGDASPGQAPEQASIMRRFTISGAASLFIAACIPVYTMEVERIWIFLTPLVVIPAAAVLGKFDQEAGSTATLWTIRLLLGQAILTEILLGTYW